MADRYVLVTRGTFRLTYAIAGLSLFWTGLIYLDGWPPGLPEILITAVFLIVGCWKALFWNPITVLEVHDASVHLWFRRGYKVVLRSADLVMMAEYRFGGAMKWTGLRFRMRDGTEYQTWAINDSLRARIAHRVASRLSLVLRDPVEGFHTWTR